MGSMIFLSRRAKNTKLRVTLTSSAMTKDHHTIFTLPVLLSSQAAGSRTTSWRQTEMIRPREEWEHWANADSAVVHPDWRGNGLQRKLLEAALPLVRPGIVGIGATVSPENQYSLNNALACGFVIADRREMYGGYDRYLLKKML